MGLKMKDLNLKNAEIQEYGRKIDKCKGRTVVAC